MPESAPSLFVLIAAYRDAECGATVADLFAQAAHPQRIRVGVCWQHAGDDAPFTGPPGRHLQIRRIDIAAAESQGANWARARAATLWQGEDFVLCIDAHMRFEPGWDEQLLAQWRRCATPLAVLSTAPAGYTPPRVIDPCHRTLRSCVQVTQVEAWPWGCSPVHLGGGLFPRAGERGGIRRTALLVACFVFARAQILQQVPIDPHYAFYGDELSWSARLWTHGWDIFQPESTLIYHWWKTPADAQAPYRRLADARHRASLHRLASLLCPWKLPSDQPPVELGAFGLGRERSLNSYWLFAGLDIVRGRAAEHARQGRFDDSWLGARWADGERPSRPRGSVSAPA